MTVSTPLSLYEAALKQGDYQPDDVQRKTVLHLQQIYHALLKETPPEKKFANTAIIRANSHKKTDCCTRTWFIYVGWRWTR